VDFDSFTVGAEQAVKRSPSSITPSFCISNWRQVTYMSRARLAIFGFLEDN